MKSSRERDQQRLQAIHWGDLETAYGSAEVVPRLILDFLYGKERVAVAAGSNLQNHLCHQYTRVSTAAAPAASFCMSALARPEPRVLEEALDLVRGFAWGTEPTRDDLEPWHQELRALVVAQLPRVRELAQHENESLADTAKLLLEEMDEQDARS
ncbi:MAG: hypothetical protein AB8H80_04965 [Planctomycetota bacterium]